MNFSEVFKLSNQLCKFSPNGKYLASCVQYRLVIRDVSTLQILQLYTCLDQIQYIEWSSDSMFILCAMYKRGLVQVWSLEQPDWHCKIDEGSAGLVSSCWSPDGRHILNTTEFHYKVLLYSLDGRLLSSYCAYEWSLGIKSVAWSPMSQFLAIGSFDEKIRILNHVTWKPIKEFEHPATITNLKTVVYKEVERSAGIRADDFPFTTPRGNPTSLFSNHSKYEIAQVPVSLRTIKPDSDRANPDLGIGLLAFSANNRYLASKNDNMPYCVWIWDIQKMRPFVVLEQTSVVRAFHWDPVQPRLAICTGNNRVYLWSPTGSVSVQVPAEGVFNVLSVSWHPLEQDSLLVMSKDQLCLCYLETEEEEK
eukprot:XP_017950804.1 PREDICTED: WD repeat-containing protein WRAP73 isoform X2 [Xenopus tropicalis]